MLNIDKYKFDLFWMIYFIAKKHSERPVTNKNEIVENLQVEF